MKKPLVFLALVTAALVLVLMTGCALFEPASTSKSPSDGGSVVQTVGITVTTDDFTHDAHPVLGVAMNPQNALTVTLGANPTTGYQWNSDAVISSDAVAQVSQVYVEPTSGALGAPGQDVWTFNAVHSGNATLSFSYARPFESVPPTWTLTLNVTVR